MKKILSIALLGLLICSSLVLAQGNQIKFSQESGQNIGQMEQAQNRFQERYNFTCEGECVQIQLEDGTNRLEIQMQKRFLFWNVNTEDSYEFNENGELIQAQHNFWSRLLNRNKVVA